ncbi:uncharacterized protein LOC113346789 [Papaver somniferum]|uniref:uncharacterized protein LOC113346789 n=1 Tax=Papaver somniferum TaxID=3469 RepID=UPI000E6F7F38|nr:uncharacterized protein LOC113346789 [Papaver somniferum]
MIKFIDGKNGSTSVQQVPITSWSRFVQRPSPPTSSSQPEIPKEATDIKVTSTQNPIKYNFRKNQGKGVWIAEPKIKCSSSFCNKLNLPGMQKMVIHNSVSNNKGNIWLFWNQALSTPIVISMSSQMITLDVGGSLISGVHAHVGYIQRRILWSEMEAISVMNKPWMIIGDFNGVVSPDEKFGGRSPHRRAMLDFTTCLDNCELLQSPKTWLQFSWSNCQYGNKRILCCLDRAMFNNLWLQKYADWGYKVGLRIASDHSPLLGGCANIPKPKNVPQKFQKLWLSHPTFMQVVQDCWSELIEGDPAVVFQNAETKVNEAMQHSDNNPYDVEALEKLVEAQNLYNSQEFHLSSLLKEKSRVKWIKEGATNTNYFHTRLKIRQAKNCISELKTANSEIISDQGKIADELVITDEDQKMLDAMPEEEEIRATIFSMDPDRSPGPDGFSGCLYRACWNIIKEDVIQAIQFCWRRRYIPKGLNSNFLVLLPKVDGAKTPSQFRPIGLSNVSFKIFTKLITNRMSVLMTKLISPQQATYVKGRSIQEQILLSSEMVNEMKKKRRGGNVSLKLDISQAYDSVNWNFLFQVLEKFGFSESWCEWLHTLFKSAKISVMVTGGPCGFFSVGRGFRQGDPLSPILFVLMEDALSRNLSASVQEKKISPNDDVFIFLNGAKKSIEILTQLLDTYQSSSGQLINRGKSKCFIDGTSSQRKLQIKEWLKMDVSEFSDKYLGVILAPGRVKSSIVWPIVEMLQQKLVGWKERMLSFQDRLVLIKFVLCSIPMYNMAVYKWPASIIKICEKIIRNFLWCEGDTRKYNILAWKRVCTPYSEGGLGIQRLEVINKSLLMKMMWRIMKSNDDWALFFKEKYMNKNGVWRDNWQLSSVWPGLRWAWSSLKDGLKWCIGDGHQISAWFDTWIGNSPLIDKIGYIQFVKDNIHMRVSDLLVNGIWNIPAVIQDAITSLILPDIGGQDELIWKVNLKGVFSVSEETNLLRGIYIDDVKMVNYGYEMVSRCCICQEAEDSMDHLLWNFPKCFDDIWRGAANKSTTIQQIWITAACACIKELWFQKNKRFFEGIAPSIPNFKCRLLKLIKEGGFRMNGTKWNQIYDLQIISFFKLGPRNSKFQSIKACQWSPPSSDFTLFCCDGASIGNPGAAGFGIVVRDHLCQVIGTMTGGFGTTTNYIAEVYAVMCTAELAVFWKCQRIIIMSDFQSVIKNSKFHGSLKLG